MKLSWSTNTVMEVVTTSHMCNNKNTYEYVIVKERSDYYKDQYILHFVGFVVTHLLSLLLLLYVYAFV
jgi:hypothetical protein